MNSLSHDDTNHWCTYIDGQPAMNQLLFLTNLPSNVTENALTTLFNKYPGKLLKRSNQCLEGIYGHQIHIYQYISIF